MPLNCPLCDSDKFIETEEVDVGRIVRGYRSGFKIDVSRFFPESHLNILRCLECDIQFFSPALPGDNDFYEALYKFPAFYESEKPEFSYALEKISEIRPQRILDVGCGRGEFLKRISKTFDLNGLEKNPTAIRELTGAGIRLDDGKEKYDFVTAFQVLEHVENPREFLNDIFGKLKENGHVLITVPNRDSKYFRETFNVLDLPPHHMTRWSKKALEYMAVSFNFGIVEYYLEPHRLEHYMGILSGRREKITMNIFEDSYIGRLVRKYIRKAGYLLDLFLAPYFIDQVTYPGHTLGILSKKKQGA